MSDPDTLLVAAIDFGTTYSGYAYSFQHEFRRDPTKTSANVWSAGARALVSLKTPTCVLLKPDGTFHSFGYEAENKYVELAEDDNHHDWYYFKRFKMMLFDKIGLKRDILLEDDKGKTMPAKTVFTMAIKFLKDHLLVRGKAQAFGLEDSEIKWVLTVPAIWNDAAKQFMREAAVDAGIDGEKLTIALEPEAASLYCRHLPVTKAGRGCDKMSLASLQPGSKYMVLDCGGGTVDITVHQIMKGGSLKELHRASGGGWGGTMVDDAFKQLFVKIMGAPVVHQFYKKHTADYMDLFRDFEVKKREVGSESSGKFTFRIPMALKEIFEEDTEEDLKETIEQSCLAGKLSWTGEKMRVDASVVKDLFQYAIDSVITHIKTLMKDYNMKGLSVILMVGGFSESPILQSAIRANFPDMTLIIPDEAGLAVLRGAVIYGHNPRMILDRVCKYTYGVDVSLPFVKNLHPECKKTLRDGKEMCSDIFDKHVEVGQTVRMGEAQVSQSYVPVQKCQKQIDLRVFASNQLSPEYVTDPACQQLGRVIIDLPDDPDEDKRGVSVQMTFGGTELTVEGRQKFTGKVTRAVLDFLG